MTRPRRDKLPTRTAVNGSASARLIGRQGGGGSPLLHYSGNLGPNAGFTLIEVLVALVIMGIGVASILVAYSGSLRLMQSARDHTVAAMLARSKLEETLASGNADITGDNADERYNGTLFGYRITTTPIALTTKAVAEKLGDLPKLEEIRVEVFWGSEDRRQRYVIAAYRHELKKPSDTKALTATPKAPLPPVN
jgi:type II secretion system protein I